MVENQSSNLVVIGGGCFWCLEAIFQRIKGISNVESGYAAGTVENPDYKQVCTGTTGHAEVVQFQYDPSVITFEDIMNIFFNIHDPTTLNRQGGDEGTQYRSIIIYQDQNQKEIAEKVMAEINDSKKYSDPIVTQLEAQGPQTKFWKAEDYHQTYFNNNQKTNGYCNSVVSEKVKKFYKNFKSQAKEEFSEDDKQRGLI